MKTINIPKSKFESLPKLKLDQKITNTEGTIYDFEYIKNHPGILKKIICDRRICFCQ
jgi:hypothetical protein